MAIDLGKIDYNSFGVSKDDEPQPNPQLRSSLSEAVKVNPDSAAKVNQLSSASGIPAFAVEQDPASVETKLNLDKIDFSTMSKRSPNTSMFLTDFNNASIAHDDVGILESIESVFDFSKVFQNFGESTRLSFSSQLKGLQAQGVDATPARIQDLIPMSAMPIGMELEAPQMSEEYAARFGITSDEQLQEARQEAEERIIGELKDLQEQKKVLEPEDLNILEQGVRSGVQSLVNMAPGVGLMVLSGGRAAPLLTTMGIQTYGEAYGSARADGLEPDVAQWYATIDATIEVGTEMLPTGTLERIITGKSGGVTKEALKFMVQEMGTEQLATLGQSINAYAFGLDEELEKAETVGEMVDIQLRRQAVTAIATVVAGGAQAGAVSGINKTIAALSRDQQQAETKGQVEQDKIDQLNAASVDSKLKQRDTEAFKQFINDADGDQNTTVFIDGAQAALYLSSKNRAEIDKDPALQLIRDQVNEASRLGTDVAIPAADFAATVAGTPHFDALREDMTLSADSVSPFRAEQVQQETRQYVQTLMNQAQENVSQYVEAQQIYDTVRTQLIDTGMVTPQNASTVAQLVPAWATVHAQQNGTTVQEVYQQSGLTIEGPQTGRMAEVTGQVLEQPQQDADIAALAEFNRQSDEYQFENFEQRETAVNNLIDRYTTDEQFTGMQLPTGSGAVMVTPSAKQEGMWQVTQFDQQGQPVSDGGIQTKEEALRDFFSEGRPDLIGEAAPLRQGIVQNQRQVKDQEAAQDLISEIADFSQVSDDGLITVYHRTTKANAEQIRKTGKMTPKEDGLFFSTKRDGEAAGFGDEIVEFKVPADQVQLDDIFDDEAHLRLPAKANRPNDVSDILVQAAPLRQEAQPQRVRDFKAELQQEFPDVKFGFSQTGNVTTLDKIIVPEDQRTAGTGTAAMQRIVDWADQNGQTVALTPSADFGGGKKRLTDFYRRFGFVENKGRNKDFEISESMYRPAAEVLTQRPDGAPEARGYYDPANAVIRLTEAADLSTFLHEFAHFMYEMERKAGSETSQKIGQWFKRNADEVAKEANSYLSDERESLAQPPVNLSRLAREVELAEKRLSERLVKFPDGHPLVNVGRRTLEKAKLSLKEAAVKREGFDKWFKSSKVVDTQGDPLIVYHGGASDITAFIRRENGRSLWASTSTVANTYAGERGGSVLYPVFLSMQNPMVFEAQGATWQQLKFEGEHISTDDLAEIAEERGHDGLIIRDLRDEDSDDGGIEAADHYSVFESGQIKSAVGNIGTFDPNNPNILAQSPEIPGQLEGGAVTAEDVRNFVDTNTTGDKGKDRAIYRAIHEQFARGFETYLMEGTAPSIELRNAFRSFARWLTQIYRAIKGNLKVNLDAEMRQVFDRMLATEDQIAAAEARARYEPMFTDAAMAGMTEEEFAAYKKRQEKVKDKQSETLRDKLIKELTRKTEAWWKEEKADLVAEEIESLQDQPVYVAANRLRTGDIKLDYVAVREMSGEERTDKLGRKRTHLPSELNKMTVKGGEGVHPDEAAAFFGYNSGDEMLTDIITAPKIKDLAESNAEKRMLEKHGDILNDGTIEQQADEAVQNEERGKLILAELRALSKGTNQPVFERQIIKALAEERIGQLAFREIFPARYRKAEIKAAQESARMLAEGNKEGAAGAKARQVLNYYLGMAATAAKSDTMNIVDRMGRYNTKRVREAIQKADGGYWDQIVKILGRFEFRKSATLKEVQDINTWMRDRIEQDGDGLVLSPEVLNESMVTHWKNVPFSQLQGIADSVKNIEHVARYANKIDVLQEKMDFDTLVSSWTDHIKSISSKYTTKESRSRAEDVSREGFTEKVNKFISQMTKVPFLASWLDGGERVGMSHDIMVQRFTDALNDKLNLMDEVARPVYDMIADRDKETRARHARKIHIPEINDDLYGHQVLAVALNTGNQSNLKKMLLGEGWANPENEAEITFNNPKLQAVLQHMTRADWVMVQKIWDQMELLYPQLAEVHRRTTGLVPPKIESTPIQTPYGEFKGGYYPVKYSPKRGYDAEKNAEKQQAETESMFSNYSSINASVNAGATNERTGFYAPILLDLSVIPDHFHETIHFITHHDAVRQMNKLINDKRVQSAITGAVGEEEFKQLKPWINDIAKDGREQPTKTFIHRAFNQLRFGVTLGAMGFKASTGIMQFFGLFTTAAELGPLSTIKGVRSAIGGAWYMRAIRKTLGSTSNMESSWKFASDKSKVLKHRTDTMDREIRAAMERLSGKRGFIAATQEASMKHIALIQTYMVDLPTWFAAYDKTISETGDETKAVNYADWAVENLQGSGATKDMAQILRNQDKIHTTFTMFMTFFSSLGNLSRDTYRGAKDGKYSLTNTAAKLMFLYTLPVFVEMMMRGEFEEPEDEDERLQKFLTNLALYPVASVPFARDVASGVFSEYGYNVTPVASLLERGIMGYKQIGERAFTDEEITAGALKGAVKLTGAAFGIPGINQAWSTGEHLYDVIEEGEDLTLRQFLFGPDRD